MSSSEASAAQNYLSSPQESTICEKLFRGILKLFFLKKSIKTEYQYISKKLKKKETQQKVKSTNLPPSENFSILAGGLSPIPE